MTWCDSQLPDEVADMLDYNFHHGAGLARTFSPGSAWKGGKGGKATRGKGKGGKGGKGKHSKGKVEGKGKSTASSSSSVWVPPESGSWSMEI